MNSLRDVRYEIHSNRVNFFFTGDKYSYTFALQQVVKHLPSIFSQIDGPSRNVELVLDFHGVEFITGKFLATLGQLISRTRNLEATLYAINVAPVPREILRLTRVDQVMEVKDLT